MSLSQWVCKYYDKRFSSNSANKGEIYKYTYGYNIHSGTCLFCTTSEHLILMFYISQATGYMSAVRTCMKMYEYLSYVRTTYCSRHLTWCFLFWKEKYVLQLNRHNKTENIIKECYICTYVPVIYIVWMLLYWNICKYVIQAKLYVNKYLIVGIVS